MSLRPLPNLPAPSLSSQGPLGCAAFSRMRAVLLALCCTLLLPGLDAETVICKSTRTNSPSFHHRERDQVSSGARMKIKYFEQFGLTDYDVSGLKGKKIKEAWLHVKAAGGHKFGLNKGTDLTWISVTTLSENWDHRKACANRSGIRDDWGWPGAKTYDVACGNGNTLRCDTRLDPVGGSHRAKLDPALVKALVVGASYGLFIMDGSTHYSMNCRIQDPRLEVVVEDTDTDPPDKVSDLSIAPAPNWAEADYGAALLTVMPPEDAFAYHIKVDGKAIQRWQRPFATPGETQTFQLVDLPPDKDLTVEVVAVDGAGNVSAPVSVSGKTSPKLTVPKLPRYGFQPKAGEPKSLGAAKVYAFPELTKIDPTSGKVLQEKGDGDFSKKNSVWDGATGTARLAAARAEIVSFQIAIEGEIKGVEVAVSDLSTDDVKIRNSGVKLWRNWYVKRHAEYALPWTGSVDCPMEDNAVPEQVHQAVTVDYHVPKDASPGNYTGKVTLSSGPDRAELALQVRVYSAVIPDEVFFNPELNCYGGPGRAGSEKFFNSLKIAHYHRTTINRVPYSQGGRVHSDWSPDVSRSGAVTDWSRFDRNIGPLLDGSIFEDNPRSGVPVATLYLPHFEGWPLDYRAHYDPGPGCPKGGKDSQLMIKHHILARPIDEAIDQAFKDGWVQCVRDFYTHATERGWTKTAFECYLNNKPGWGYTCWTLDEPNIYRDWEGINFFGRLWKEGLNDPEVYTHQWQQDYFRQGLHGLNRDRPTFLFRGDISRPNWQGSLSDGIINIMYLGGGAFDKPRMVRNHKVRMPCIMYAYGSCPSHLASKWQTAAWCLKSFVQECDGVLPWQSLGKGLNNPDPKGSGNALIVDGGEYGNAIASLRVHAMRRGAQDCELMRLLMLKKGWSRQHLGVLISPKVPLPAKYNPRFTDEAAALAFKTLTSQGFIEMKEGILQLLEQE